MISAWLMLTGVLLARSSRTSVIDDFCLAIRNEFVEATPEYYSGPDPWVKLERTPDSFTDAAVATVYCEGTRVKWVVLKMQGPGNTWFETTDYFFGQDGLIQKRERRLDQYASHIEIREDQYFSARKLMKVSYHHTLLPGSDSRDKENWETFYDPNAPSYRGTFDLPGIFSEVEFQRLAGLADKIQRSRHFSGLPK